MSRRSDIRAAVKAALEADAAFTGVTVSTDRHRSIDERDLPVILIATGDTERSADSADDVLYDVSLEVVAYVKGTTAETAEDALDRLGDAIERVLLADQSLGGIVQYVTPGPQQAEFEDEEYVLGVLVSVFSVRARYEVL